MRDALDCLSCDPARLYGNGEITDADVSLDRLIETSHRYRGQIEVVAEIYPAARVHRPLPAGIDGPDTAFVDALLRYFAEVNRTWPRISPSVLVRIGRALIWNNMLFAVADGHALPIYELYRPTDRAHKGSNLLSRLAACESRSRLDPNGAARLFVGSAGSFNYGHWLVDDLPSLACYDVLSRLEPACEIVMTGMAYDGMDLTRSEGVALALKNRGDYCIRYLDPDTAYAVDDLYYVTPVSYHAACKHPLALRYLREVCSAAAGHDRAPAQKLFVNRSPKYFRRLSNDAAVVESLSAMGYAEYVPNEHPLIEQWATFSAATDIVGIMGAGMTSMLFSPPGSRITSLAASGWMEPFFWDLAAMGRHEYRAVFGAAEPGDAPLFQRSFSIDPDAIAAALTGGAWA